MSDLMTAVAGVLLALLFPIAVIAVYRWQAREEEKLQRWVEEDSAMARKWAYEERDNIESRARRHQ